jgi:hypothetical protein
VCAEPQAGVISFGGEALDVPHVAKARRLLEHALECADNALDDCLKVNVGAAARDSRRFQLG